MGIAMVMFWLQEMRSEMAGGKSPFFIGQPRSPIYKKCKCFESPTHKLG